MPIAHRTTHHRIDCTSLGTRVVIPVAEFTSMMIELEPVGTTATAVLTLKRGLNRDGDFETWAAGAVTLGAAGLYPVTKVFNVAGFSHVALEVTTAQADFEYLVTVYVNDSLNLSVAT